MTKLALEVVEFKLSKGETKDTFLAALDETRHFISSLDGFLERHTAYGDDGLWVDVVKWRDLESAKNAAKQFDTAVEVKNFMMMIDFETIRMQHFEIENTMHNVAI